MKLNKLVGAKGLLLVLFGYFVFSLGLGLSIASSMLVFFYGPGEPRGPPGLIAGARRGLFIGKELAFRVGFAAWSIIGYSSIAYAASYLLMLTGLITSRYRIGEANLEENNDVRQVSSTIAFAPITILGAA